MTVRIVTGCSSGFGEVIALGLARLGGTVIATMRRPGDASPALRAALNVRIAALDVTDAAARSDFIAGVMAEFGRIDTLVNNAGVAAYMSLEDTSEDVHRLLFETNYFGPVALMRAVLPIMREQGGGRIINVTAIGAVMSTPLLSAYCATKHALDSAAASLDIEGRPFNVRAPSVLPGQFQTSIAIKGPAAIVSEPYEGIAVALAASRDARRADVLADLSPVSEAVIAAATDADPKPRYMIGAGIAQNLLPALAEFERLHALEVARCGLPARAA